MDINIAAVLQNLCNRLKSGDFSQRLNVVYRLS